MTCDVTRNRLLALPDLTRPTDDLRAHLTTCAACAAWLERARQLDLSVAGLQAPDSSEARAAFVDYLAAAGPVIKSVPKVNPSAGFPLIAFFRKLDWRVVSGLAASAAVGVGIWQY